MRYRYVLLGDVVGSRDIEDREAFRRTLVDACETANETCGSDLDAPFELLKGIDELGGVLTSPAPVYDVVDEFAAALRPHEIRVAVAAGGIDVAPESGDVTRMDGPAFHRADELLAALADAPFRFAMDLDGPADSGCGDSADAPTGDTNRDDAHDAAVDRRADALDDALADEINLLLFRKREWTDRQREVVARYEEHGSQREVAEALGVSQPAVSRALDRAMWTPLREIEDRLRETLAQYE